MKKRVILLFLSVMASCNSKIDRSQAFVPESSGNLNHVTVVMPESDWNSSLGNTIRTSMGSIYEGLPLDEPRYSLRYMNSIAFTGFARQNRNIIWFQKDSISRFQLAKNQFARPQILALVTGEDTDAQAFTFNENMELLMQTLGENERIEKLRRINKSLSTEKNLTDRFGIFLKYPSAYKTVKDTTNFVWIQKPIQKGHLNIISYVLPLNALNGVFNKRILNIRDSIGKIFVPGRLPGSFLITERAFRPYFYKVFLDGKQGYLTKGTWEVKNDFMAGPFVNYMISDTINKRIIVLEGFAFAPSVSKREYMFELNTILNTFKSKN
ncbi:MAG: DUF4837 family protein [Flavobacteriaceae bacterium]|nr:DUF4837 family protein [Flavobacteriaceae bacterium]